MLPFSRLHTLRNRAQIDQFSESLRVPSENRVFRKCIVFVFVLYSVVKCGVNADKAVMGRQPITKLILLGQAPVTGLFRFTESEVYQRVGT